ncbi:NADH-quinone oxidoreductase subunit N [bacterium]|nr:NADH-quinone oxidoreductase subunit N [bacterium]
MSSAIETIANSARLVIPASTMLLSGCAFYGVAAVVDPPKPNQIQTYRRCWGWGALAVWLLVTALSFSRSDVNLDVASGLFRFDSVSLAAERLTLLGGLITILIGWSSVSARALPEYYGSLAIMLSGLMLVGSANDLTTLFLGLELVSIPTYVLLAIARGDRAGRESTLKYFSLSSFSSCFFLLGASYLYGLAGSTDLITIHEVVGSRETLMGAVALIAVISGLAFRITAVPFHFYAPDVFQGTTVPLAAILAYLPKVAGVIAIIRVVGVGTNELSSTAEYILLILAVLTMTVGNSLALVQSKLIRLLAYSSVAHSGYILVGIAAGINGIAPLEPVYFYLAAYAVMTLGVFAIIAGVESTGQKIEKIDDLAGLVQRFPAAAAALAICLTSLIGLPLTAGFWAKLEIFLSAIASDDLLFRWVAVIMAANAVIAAGYYLRVLGKLFEPGRGGLPSKPWDRSLIYATALCAVLTILWFFQPNRLI